LKKFHDSPLHGCHQGRDKMLGVLQLQYYWFGMKHAIEEYIKKCEVCSRWKASTTKPPLIPIIAERKNERWLIDFSELETDSLGMKWMLLLIDSFSKYIWGTSFATKEAINVAQFVFETILREGKPSKLQHDNGGEFIAKVLQDQLSAFGITDVRIAPYSPNVDGQIERPNGTIKKKLGILVEQLKLPWSQCLQFAISQ